MLSFFPLDFLDEIWDLIESVSERLPTYSLLHVMIGMAFLHLIQSETTVYGFVRKCVNSHLSLRQCLY